MEIKPVLTQNIHISYNKFKKSAVKNVIFQAQNQSDQFIRSNNKISLSFTGKEIDKLKELKTLQYEYLNLYFDPTKTPEALMDSDGDLFEFYLLKNEKPEDIVKNHFEDFLDASRVKNVLESSIDSVPVIKILNNYQSFLMAANKLSSRISKLEEELNLIGKSHEKPQQNIKNYIKFVRESTPRSSDSNFSECLRYKELYPHVKELVENRINTVLKSDTAKFTTNNKLKFLVVGLGKKSEEIHDYATYAYNSITGNNLKLDDVLDFEMVDFRSRDNFIRGYLNFPRIEDYSLRKLPDEISNKLIKAPFIHKLFTYPTDILDFVYDSLRKPAKLHCGFTIESYVESYNGEGYDFVSINNVLQYPGIGESTEAKGIEDIDKKYHFMNPLQFRTFKDDKKFDQYKNLLRKIARMVKPGGILCCKVVGLNQEKLDNQIQWSGITEEFEKIEPGLYRRKQT